ncbi:MAG: 2-(S)-hydroxypropyl-CoM dehydrogenase [Alphaproteobacteria bacterium MarineAlpha5_Bin4]|nr:MAG: 2-(S)-hydroxypropyl-CoM dehydrogenase [Alphaproteobacteria bacterium MarineAlpha5_Bin4]|tara:strand:+ start:891 stop:1664 length:774 start_codon:yes stop_codon:yes gene_type:complete
MLNKKIFIISAAADGIGLSITKNIVKHGGKVYLTDIDQKKIESIKSKKEFKNKVYANQLDSNNFDDVKRYFKSLKSITKIDGLINNVGIAGPTKNLDKIKIEEWKKTLEVNLNSFFYFSKLAIPLLKKNKAGSIINISSTAGLYGFPQRTPYAVSKWGVIGLTKSLAMELGKYNIRVNAICPGSVSGNRMRRVIKAKADLLKINSKKIQSEFESMTSMKSFVSKDDISSIVIYLLSDNSKSISGQAIAIDGNTERMN